MKVESGTCGRAIAAGLLLLCAAPVAVAQTYPSRPVRVVVAFGPGGIADTIARLVGQKLGERFEQPVVVDNRAGAGGTVGARLVAVAMPDGYTLLVVTAAVAVNASVAKDAVDPHKDLVPVALAATAPTVFVVNRTVTAKTLMDYVRNAKGGRFTYSTAGIGTTEHLASDYVFRVVSGLDPTHVPFQGGLAPVTAVLGQQVDMTVTTVPTAFQFIKQGALRALATASLKRVSVLPDVPTLAEAGFPEFENASWIGFFAPAKTSPVVVRMLNAEINKVLRQSDVRERLATIGFDPHTGSDAEFAGFVRTEVAKWSRVVKATGFSVN